MKKKLLVMFVFFLGVITAHSQEYKVMIDEGTFSVEEIIENAEAYFADIDKGRGSGYKQFKRWEYNAMRLMNENGYLPTSEENIAELERYNAYLNETSQNRQAGTDNWEELGPFNYNATSAWSPGLGRITGVDIDKNDIDHIIVGAQTGGVWSTTDGGLNWTPLGDFFSNLSVYSVVIDPANSNNYIFGSDNGLIYKSTDSGATWNQLGDLGTSNVNRILIHPTDSNIMFATSQNGGIKKSIDGGVTWTSAVTDNRGYDLEFKPGDPSVVYASGNSVHISTDGGDTFTTIGGFPTAPKMMAVSLDDPEVVYVVEASGGSFGGFYVSNDSGSSFTELNHAGRNYFGYDTNGVDSGGQAPRDMDVAVNPADVNEVHIAGVLTWRSMNGGVDFENTSDWIPTQAENAGKGYCHADVDLLVFAGTTMFAGTDGGLFKAENTPVLNATYFESIHQGLGIRQNYKLGITQSQDVIISGGSQDNGTSFYTSEEGWRDWLGADGMESFIDKDNPLRMFGTSQNGQLYRTDNGGLTQNGLSEPGVGQGNWVTPFEQDPTVTNTIYLGYNFVYKSESGGGGGSWVEISQQFPSSLDHLKIAPSNNQVMYAGRSTFLYKTTDGGATDWEIMTPPVGLIRSIAIHPTNPDLVAVATSSGDKVVVSSDGGVTWNSYLFNLPNFSAMSVVWDDNGAEALYVGMNYGIYYIDNTFTEWQPYSNNLPNVIINEMEINSMDGKIYAATYGRGFWSSQKGNPNLGTEDFISESSIALYPNPANSTVTINLQKSVDADIRVFDILGKLVIYQADVSISNEHTMDISELNNGIYFIRINSDKGAVTKKLIKE